MVPPSGGDACECAQEVLVKNVLTLEQEVGFR